MKKNINNLRLYREMLLNFETPKFIKVSKKLIYSSKPDKSLGLHVTKNLTLTAKETRKYNKYLI